MHEEQPRQIPPTNSSNLSIRLFEDRSHAVVELLKLEYLPCLLSPVGAALYSPGRKPWVFEAVNKAL